MDKNYKVIKVDKQKGEFTFEKLPKYDQELNDKITFSCKYDLQGKIEYIQDLENLVQIVWRL